MDTSILHQLLGQGGGHATAAQACLRAVVIFVYGWVLVRLAGRRIFGRWAALDIVVSITAGSNLSRALTGNAELWPTLAATTVLVALHWLAASLAVHWRRAAPLIEGRPVQVVDDGEPVLPAMRRRHVTFADIEEAMRGAGLQDLSAVRTATLEPSGKISILRR